MRIFATLCLKIVSQSTGKHQLPSVSSYIFL